MQAVNLTVKLSDALNMLYVCDQRMMEGKRLAKEDPDSAWVFNESANNWSELRAGIVRDIREQFPDMPVA